MSVYPRDMSQHVRVASIACVFASVFLKRISIVRVALCVFRWVCLRLCKACVYETAGVISRYLCLCSTQLYIFYSFSNLVLF